MLSEKADGKMAKHKSSKSRVKLFRERQASMGRTKREPYLTDNEWVKVKGYIAELRKSA